MSYLVPLYTTLLSISTLIISISFLGLSIAPKKNFSIKGIASGNMLVSDPISLQYKIAAIRAHGPFKLQRENVPILIFSAGLADIIEEVLRQKVQRSFKNIEIVSNRMVFDNQGTISAFKGKTIHVPNKNEHALDIWQHLCMIKLELWMDLLLIMLE